MESFSAAKPATLSVTDIRIAKPCPADWNSMVGDERTRHCSECNLNVYNFSAMTEPEVANLIAYHQGSRLCARFYRRADGTILTQDCPWGWRALKRRAARFAGAVLSVIMSVGFAVAKGKPQQTQQSCQRASESESQIAITVTDQDGALIPNAQIALETDKGKKHFAGATGPSGEWKQKRLHSGKYALTVQSPGFKTFSGFIDLQDGHFTGLKIILPISAANTTVTVEAAVGVVMGTTVGVLTTEKPGAIFPSQSGGRPAPMRP